MQAWVITCYLMLYLHFALVFCIVTVLNHKFAL